MMKYRWKHWFEFHTAALASVRALLHSLPEGREKLLAVAFIPSFANPFSWMITSDRETSPVMGGQVLDYQAVRRCWRFDKDYPDIDKPDYAGPDSDQPGFREYVVTHLPDFPTIEETSITIASPLVDSFLEESRTLTVSVCPLGTKYIEDGDSYAIMFWRGACQSHFCWSANGPSEWKGLTDFTRRLLDCLEEVGQQNG